MTKRAVIWVAAILATGALLAGLVAASGMRFYTVMTPSMGRTAPVGTLVVTRPAASYAVGDIVTYERGDRSYTHRIITANPDGTFITKGDLNGSADALPVTVDQIIGRAAFVAPGLGWLWRALPWLVLGGLLVYGGSLLGRLDHTWRWVLRITGWTLVFCAVAFWLRPWVSLAQLSWVPAGSGVDMHVVNTGLFPLDVLGNRLVSGQDAVVHVTEQNHDGYFVLVPGLAFQWWEQVGLFLLCLLPAALSFLIRDASALKPSRAVPEQGEDPDAEPVDAPAPVGHRPERNRLILIGTTVAAIVVGVAVVTFTTTQAALTAKIQNTGNTAGTRAFFSCRNAISSLGTGSTSVAFAMGTTGSTESDLLGRTTAANNGAYNVAATTSTSYACKQDNPKASVTFNGTSQCLATKATYSNPQTLSLEAWFLTSSTKATKVIGFGATQFNASESTYDRHVYVDQNGRVVFGVYISGYSTISSPAGTDYSDGKWHHVVATYKGGTGGTGSKLYLDGVLVASNSSYLNAENTTGYWKIGCGNLSGWPDANGTTLTTTNSSSWFAGQIQYAAVYTAELTAQQVADHYAAAS